MKLKVYVKNGFHKATKVLLQDMQNANEEDKNKIK
mgnify:CR=1 FL=1